MDLSSEVMIVFLCVVLLDIDQLKLIMLLVGTPGPELLMKISSESVSFWEVLVCLKR